MQFFIIGLDFYYFLFCCVAYFFIILNFKYEISCLIEMIVISFELKIYSPTVLRTNDSSKKRQNDEYKKSHSLSSFCCDTHYRERGL